MRPVGAFSQSGAGLHFGFGRLSCRRKAALTWRRRPSRPLLVRHGLPLPVTSPCCLCGRRARYNTPEGHLSRGYVALSMKRERLFAALLFAVAATLFWLGFIAIFEEAQGTFVVAGATASVSAAALVAALLAPKLIADAHRSTSTWRGVLAGIVVTLLSYVVGAVLFAVGAVMWDVATGGPDRLAMAGPGAFLMIFFGLWYAVTYMSPALVFGGLAGLIFYRLARLENQNAT